MYHAKIARAIHSTVSAVAETLEPRTLLTVEAATLADSFVDSIGVVTHIPGSTGEYSDTYYGNYDGVKQLLLDLGIRHIRDGLETANDPLKVQRLNDLAASGIKGSLILRPDSAVSVAQSVSAFIEAVEGPNETDNPSFTFSYNGQSFPEGTRAYQTDLYNAIKGNPATASLPVIAPSLIGSGTLGIVPSDIANMHSYPGGQAPQLNLDSNISYAERFTSGSTPVWATETGYNNYSATTGNASVSETAAAKYITRLFLEYWSRGVTRTDTYDLVDDWSTWNPGLDNNTIESHFGLVRVSGPGPTATATPKPAYNALKNLISLMQDPGATFQSGTLDFTLGGDLTNVRHTLMQKRDGSYYLALWLGDSSFDTTTQTNLNPTPRSVTVTFNQMVGQAISYKPNQSLNVVQTYNQPTTITLSVTDEPLILKLTTVSAPPAVSSTTASVSSMGYGDGMVQAQSPYTAPFQVSSTWSDSRIGDENASQAYRAIFKFDLPTVPAGKILSGASFNYFYATKYGAPTTNAEAVAYESAYAQLMPGDWSESTAATSLGTVLTPSTAYGAQQVTGATLLQAIQNAYAHGKKQIAIRFQLVGGAFTTGGSGADFYDVLNAETATASQRPTLQFSYVDAPTNQLAARVTTGANDGMVQSQSPFSSASYILPDYSDTRIGDENTLQAYRSVYKFSLPTMPAGKIVSSVTLHLSNNVKYGNPTHDLEAVVYNSSSSSLVAGDWNDQTSLISLGSILTPSSPTGALNISNTALLQAIQAAYAAGRTHFDVRLQLAGGAFTTGGTGADFYDLGTSESTPSTSQPWIEINLVNGGTTLLSRTGWTASASLNSGQAGSAIDGNASSRWTTTASQTNGQWFQLDLGSAKTFSRLLIDSSGSSGDYARGYQVYASNDGVNWGSSIASGTGTNPVLDISFSSQTARYVRIVQTGSVGLWWSIHELNLYV